MPTPSATHPLPSAPLQVRGACPHDCPDTCALLTTVENGMATRVQGNPAHPHTDGVLCAKVSKYTERSYHPERVLTPLKRIGPKGQIGRPSTFSAMKHRMSCGLIGAMRGIIISRR